MSNIEVNDRGYLNHLQHLTLHLIPCSSVRINSYLIDTINNVTRHVRQTEKKSLARNSSRIYYTS